VLGLPWVLAESCANTHANTIAIAITIAITNLHRPGVRDG